MYCTFKLPIKKMKTTVVFCVNGDGTHTGARIATPVQEHPHWWFRIGVYGIVMVELSHHHFRLWNLEGYQIYPNLFPSGHYLI